MCSAIVSQFRSQLSQTGDNPPISCIAPCGLSARSYIFFQLDFSSGGGAPAPAKILEGQRPREPLEVAVLFVPAAARRRSLRPTGQKTATQLAGVSQGIEKLTKIFEWHSGTTTWPNTRKEILRLIRAYTHQSYPCRKHERRRKHAGTSTASCLIWQRYVLLVRIAHKARLRAR